MNKVLLFLCLVIAVFSNRVSLYAQKSGQIGITSLIERRSGYLFDVSSEFNIGAIYHINETFAVQSFFSFSREKDKNIDVNTNSLSYGDSKNFGLNAIGIGGLYYLKPLDEIVPYIGIMLSYWYNPYSHKTDGDAQGNGGFITDTYQKLFRMNAVMGFQYVLTTQISFTANISIRYTLQSSFQQNTPYEPYLPTNGGIAPSIYKNTTTTLDVFRSGIGLIVYLN